MTEERLAWWQRQQALHLINALPAEPARLQVSGVTLNSRDDAYLFACLIMERADALWPR